MKRLFIPILFAFLPSGCPPTNTASCADVCANMAKLNCPSSKPTARGTSCTQVCTTLQNSDIAKWNLDCRAKATSCEAADLCESE